MGVALGVEHCTSSGADRDRDHTRHHDHRRLPRGPGVLHLDASLLRAVGKVVVPRAHVVVRADVGHLHEPAVEVGSGSGVEHHAVLVVLLHVGRISTVLREEGGVVEAVDLVEVRHERAGIGVLEEADLAVGDGVVLRHVGDLNDVGAVGRGLAFSCVARWVGIAPSPLDYEMAKMSVYGKKYNNMTMRKTR